MWCTPHVVHHHVVHPPRCAAPTLCTPHVVHPPRRSLHGTSCCPCCRYSASMPALPPTRALFLCLPCGTLVAAPPTALKPRCVTGKASVVPGRLLHAQNASHTQDLRTTGWHQFPGPAGPHRGHATPPGDMHEGREGPGEALPCKTHPTSAGESGATCASAAARGLPDPAVSRSSFPSRPSLRERLHLQLWHPAASTRARPAAPLPTSSAGWRLMCFPRLEPALKAWPVTDFDDAELDDLLSWLQEPEEASGGAPALAPAARPLQVAFRRRRDVVWGKRPGATASRANLGSHRLLPTLTQPRKRRRRGTSRWSRPRPTRRLALPP